MKRPNPPTLLPAKIDTESPQVDEIVRTCALTDSLDFIKLIELATFLEKENTQLRQERDDAIDAFYVARDTLRPFAIKGMELSWGGNQVHFSVFPRNVAKANHVIEYGLNCFKIDCRAEANKAN